MRALDKSCNYNVEAAPPGRGETREEVEISNI